MLVFYVWDSDGEYGSSNCGMSYKRYVGKEAYQFSKTEDGRKRYFASGSDEDDENELWYEVTPENECLDKKVRNSDEYRSRLKKQANIEVISMDQILAKSVDGEVVRLEDTIPDQTESIEELLNKKFESELLIAAVKSLDQDDQMLIQALYLDDELETETSYSKQKGVSQQAIAKQKKKVFEKIKKYFSKFGCSS